VVLTTLPESDLRGAVAVPAEVVEKPVEPILEHIGIETIQLQPSPAEAAQIVLSSPRACRTVLESLTAEADSGRLDAAAPPQRCGPLSACWRRSDPHDS
jgi:hypothetical protein